jgi:hypothetical protein
MSCITAQNISRLLRDASIPVSIIANCTAAAAPALDRAWPNGDTWISVTTGVVAISVAILQLVLGNRIANAINRL